MRSPNGTQSAKGLALQWPGRSWIAASATACIWLGLWRALRRHPEPELLSLLFHPVFVLAYWVVSTLLAALDHPAKGANE